MYCQNHFLYLLVNYNPMSHEGQRLLLLIDVAQTKIIEGQQTIESFS